MTALAEVVPLARPEGLGRARTTDDWLGWYAESCAITAA